VTKAAFPDTVTAHVQYGSRVRATAVYLNVQQLIPEDRVCETMVDLFAAASLCPASVVAWTTKAAEAQAPVVAHIAARVVAAKVRHLDETGFRIGGKTRWLHSASTAVYTLYRIGEKRGDVPSTPRRKKRPHFDGAHAASGLPVLVHLNGLASVLLK
jgi:transposase